MRISPKQAMQSIKSQTVKNVLDSTFKSPVSVETYRETMTLASPLLESPNKKDGTESEMACRNAHYQTQVSAQLNL